MNCTELESDLRRLAAERATEVEWLAVCRCREAEARRDIAITKEQLSAIDLQIDRVEDAIERCMAYRGRR